MAELIIPVGMEVDSSVSRAFAGVAANAEQTSKRVARALSQSAYVQKEHRAIQASAEKTFAAVAAAAVKAGMASQTALTGQLATQKKVTAAVNAAAGAQVVAMQGVAVAQQAQLQTMIQNQANYANRVVAMNKLIATTAQQATVAQTALRQVRVGSGGGGGGGPSLGPAGIPPGQGRLAALITGSQLNGAFNKGISNVSGMGREVAQGMGISFDVGTSMQRNLSINREATQLAIQGNSKDVAGTAAEIETSARDIALKTGANVEDIVKGLRAFQAYTGDLAGGMNQLKNMSASSVAYDTPIEDMASLYAVITKYMGKDGTAAGVDALVRTIAMQGRAGAVEIRDQIKQDPKILVGASQFAVTPTQLKQYGGDKKAAQAAMALGLMQGIMGVSGESAQQSGNAVKSFMDSLSVEKNEKGMAKHGIDIYTKDPDTGRKVYKPITELIAAASAKMIEDPKFAREMMGNVRGRKVMQAFAPMAMQAYDDSIKSGTNPDEAVKAGAQAAFTEMNMIAAKFQDAAGRAADVENFLASEAGKAAQLQAKMREAMDQATKNIILSVEKNLPQIEAGMGLFGKLLSFGAQNPGLAVGGAVALPIAQQVAANAIGAASSQFLVPLLGPAASALASALGGITLPAVAAAAALAGIGYAVAKYFNIGGINDPSASEVARREEKYKTFGEDSLSYSHAAPAGGGPISGFDGDTMFGGGGYGGTGNWVTNTDPNAHDAPAASGDMQALGADDMAQAFIKALRDTPITVKNMPTDVGSGGRGSALTLGGGNF
jgi:hypothetical protein